MAHEIDSFGYSTNVEKFVWWKDCNDYDRSRVHCWGADQLPDVAYKIAHMDEAEPVLTPLSWRDGNGVDRPVTGDDYRGYRRADDRGLIAIVGPGHRFFTNYDLMRIIPWPVHTAGVLAGGRRVFAQANIPGINLDVRRGPNGRELKIAPNLLAYNTHDSTGRLVFAFSETIAVCQNTVTAALSEKLMSISFKHRTGILDTAHIEAMVAEMYTTALESYEHQRQTLQKFAEQRLPESEARRFFATLLTDSENWAEAEPKIAALAEQERLAAAAGKSNRAVTIFAAKGKQLMDLYSEGLGQRADDTKVKLGALQAVTEFIDHQRGRSAQWRTKAANIFNGLNSSMFGDGAKTKQQAVRLLAKW